MDETSNTTEYRPSTVPPAPKKDGWKDTLSTLGIIILAPIIALLLTTFVFQSYQVDGPSMETTLQDRDRLIVTKIGPTWSRIFGNQYAPERNEVIIFNHSGEFEDSQVQEKQLIKRVIGIPGDRVVIKDGVVTVYNQQHPQGYLVDREGPQKNTISTTPGNIDESVAENEIYVMGDNRMNSLDSRTFGTIRNADVVGKLAVRIYPLDKFEKF